MSAYAKLFRFTLHVQFLDVNGETRSYRYQWVDSDMLSPIKVAGEIAQQGMVISEDPHRFPLLPFVLIPSHRILTIRSDDEPPTPVESPAARAARLD